MIDNELSNLIFLKFVKLEDACPKIMFPSGNELINNSYKNSLLKYANKSLFIIKNKIEKFKKQLF